MASKTEDCATVEKENNNEESTDKPLGVKFTYGIPGREVQNKNRVDLPPRPTTTAPKAQQSQHHHHHQPRGGGVAGRGFGRGRGQNHGHRGAHGGGYHGHGGHGGHDRYQGQQGHHGKSKNRPASPKTGGNKGGSDKDKEKEKSESTCDFCDRPCTQVTCSACGYVGANLRVKKECSKHPRIIRVLDLEVCPQCKTANIEESEPAAPEEAEKK